MTHKSISLFSGAGGLDLGLHCAGFRAAVAVECDSAATATLRLPENAAWWSDTEILDEPIEKIPTGRLLRAGRLKRGTVALLVGGPPCQPFSKSGYWHSGDAGRLSDPRAGTLRQYLRVLEESLPETFLLENVPGLAFSDKDEGLELLRAEIARINRRTRSKYKLCAAQLNAAEYGVPQTRERVFVVGSRAGLPFEFPKPTHQKPTPVDMAGGTLAPLPRRPINGLLPCLTAWDAIGSIPPDEDPALLALRGKWADLLPSIPEGHNYLFHTDRGRGVSIFGWRRRYWSMLLKLAKSRPSWTLTAQPGPAIGPFHWANRRLGRRELCRLQTFPNGYVIKGSLSLAYRQVGNAVPSALAQLLGHEIRRQLLGESRIRPKLTLLPDQAFRIPAEEPVSPVPDKYLPLVGEHDDHPGTGKGPGAIRRRSKTAAL